MNTANQGIETHHHQRLAVVYVRQSTLTQVKENRESTALQYRLVERAIALGWARERVLVIDEDLGQSGSSAEHRLGFQRLMTEVGLNHVGLVLGIEMSRLARSCKDWHQLLELCSVFRTLLADGDRQFNPCDYNDRLLLGLSGIMSEAELHILRMRMHRGAQNKAKRGELLSHLPIGYVRSPSNEVVLDPDQQSQSVVRLIFNKFQELGSGRKLIGYLLEHNVLLPVRPHHGPNRGQLEWRVPASATVYGILQHPAYAGAYSYGRSQVDVRRKKAGRPGTGQVRLPREEWQVLIPEKWPAYISWEEFLENQKRLTNNRASFEKLGAPREGASLVGGIVCCGKCDWRMYVGYQRSPRYVCAHHAALAGKCEGQNFAASCVDKLIGEQILLAVTPASLELSMKVEEECRREYQLLTEQWQQRLERASYKAERARRQFQAVEPENRLVARTLEHAWEQTLLEEQKIKDDFDRFQHQRSQSFSPQDRERIEILSANLPSLWMSATTTNQDRQEIVRLLVNKVVVCVQGNSEIVDVSIHWVGGNLTQHTIVRTVGSYKQLRDYDRLMTRLKELRVAGKTATEIAECLNAEGFHTPKTDKIFDKSLVDRLVSQCELLKPSQSPAREALAKHEWTLSALAREIQVPISTLQNWVYRGWVNSIKVGPRSRILWADKQELERLRQLHAHPHPAPKIPYPKELTSPKKLERT